MKKQLINYAKGEEKYPNPLLRTLKDYILRKCQENPEQPNPGAHFRGSSQ